MAAADIQSPAILFVLFTPPIQIIHHPPNHATPFPFHPSTIPPLQPWPATSNPTPSSSHSSSSQLSFSAQSSSRTSMQNASLQAPPPSPSLATSTSSALAPTETCTTSPPATAPSCISSSAPSQPSSPPTPTPSEKCSKTQEPNFASLPISSAVRHLTYGCSDLLFAPYGPYWRFMRKLCTSELLGGRPVILS